MKDWEREVNEGRVPKGMGIHIFMVSGFILMWPALLIWIIFFK